MLLLTLRTCCHTQPKDLLPNQAASMATKKWPCIKQMYDEGQECVLAGNKRVIRNTEVRFACSPDSRIHFLVREPDFCSYIYVVYLPALCEVPGMQPIEGQHVSGSA